MEVEVAVEGAVEAEVEAEVDEKVCRPAVIVVHPWVAPAAEMVFTVAVGCNSKGLRARAGTSHHITNAGRS